MDDTNPDDAIVRAPRSQSPAQPVEPRESPSDIAAIIDEDDDAAHGELDPRRAFEVLEIRTPLEEFDAYVRARVDTLARLGDSKKAELTAAALDLGRRALARVTGAPLNPPEKAPR
jgi:hypothetical protein